MRLSQGSVPTNTIAIELSFPTHGAWREGVEMLELIPANGKEWSLGGGPPLRLPRTLMRFSALSTDRTLPTC